MRDFIEQAKTNTTNERLFNVSAMKSSNATGGGYRNKRKHRDLSYDEFKDAKVDLRYYKTKAYNALSDPQKAKLSWLRDQRDGPDRKQKNKKKQSGMDASLQRSIQQLAAAVKAANLDEPEESDSDSGNRDHPALSRQKTKKARVSFE